MPTTMMTFLLQSFIKIKFVIIEPQILKIKSREESHRGSRFPSPKEQLFSKFQISQNIHSCTLRFPFTDFFCKI